MDGSPRIQWVNLGHLYITTQRNFALSNAFFKDVFHRKNKHWLASKIGLRNLEAAANT